MKKEINDIKKLKAENNKLRLENKRLKAAFPETTGATVKVPKEMTAPFDKAQKTVGKYFASLRFSPTKGSIDINGERYILVRASALSLEFLNSISHFYRDRGAEEALHIGKNILFDLAHMLGMEDARSFHKKMGLNDPMSKLSAGPVHFAYSGWAFVNILEESRPSPDENYYVRYQHPYSFEADSWVRAGKKSKFPVCIMNSGYSSGWCEASFGIPLTAVEVTCKAKGDKECTFIMAPPNRIEEYLEKKGKQKKISAVSIPSFLERKKTEEKIKSSLLEKEVLLKEIHHRVKNNLQIISSLLNLQAAKIEDETAREKYIESIGRVKSMAIIHELLYRSKNLSTIKIMDYLRELVTYISQSYSLNLKNHIKVDLEISVKRDHINISKAIPCGLIINELLSNAFKYAFPNNMKGRISIELTDSEKENGFYLLKFSDNGIGISKKVNISDPTTLGLQLIHSLVQQLDGKVQISADKGTSFIIIF
jgi:two-component sensor histidine kinase/predicted hydrocarbon binding protein